jgi:hypothetical protein
VKTYWERRYSSTHSLTSALDGGEWSASLPGRFTPREKKPATQCIGGWVGPRAVLDTVVKRKIPSPYRESNPRTPIVQPVAQRYTDWAITVLTWLSKGTKLPTPLGQQFNIQNGGHVGCRRSTWSKVAAWLDTDRLFVSGGLRHNILEYNRTPELAPLCNESRCRHVTIRNAFRRWSVTSYRVFTIPYHLHVLTARRCRNLLLTYERAKVQGVGLDTVLQCNVNCLTQISASGKKRSSAPGNSKHCHRTGNRFETANSLSNRRHESC